MTRVRPDESSFYSGALLRQFMREATAAGPKATAHGTLYRFSDVGICSRQLGYKATVHGRGHVGRGSGDAYPSEEAAQGLWTMAVGSIIHERWQAAMKHELGSLVDFEVKGLVKGRDGRPLISGHADAIVISEEGELKATVEVKTRNGTRYRKAVGGEGPSYEAVLQGAINALANMEPGETPDVVIVYLSLENTTPGTAARDGVPMDKRVVAQWTIPYSEWRPLVDAELARIQEIEDLRREGWLPERRIPDPSIPGRAIIDNPNTGHWSVEGWKKGGQTWQCRFCPFQQRCLDDGPGEVAITPKKR